MQWTACASRAPRCCCGKTAQRKQRGRSAAALAAAVCLLTSTVLVRVMTLVGPGTGTGTCRVGRSSEADTSSASAGAFGVGASSDSFESYWHAQDQATLWMELVRSVVGDAPQPSSPQSEWGLGLGLARVWARARAPVREQHRRQLCKGTLQPPCSLASWLGCQLQTVCAHVSMVMPALCLTCTTWGAGLGAAATTGAGAGAAATY